MAAIAPGVMSSYRHIQRQQSLCSPSKPFPEAPCKHPLNLTGQVCITCSCLNQSLATGMEWSVIRLDSPARGHLLWAQRGWLLKRNWSDQGRKKVLEGWLLCSQPAALTPQGWISPAWLKIMHFGPKAQIPWVVGEVLSTESAQSSPFCRLPRVAGDYTHPITIVLETGRETHRKIIISIIMNEEYAILAVATDIYGDSEVP